MEKLMRIKCILCLFMLLRFNMQSQSPDFKCGVSFNYGYNKPAKIVNLTYDFFNVGGGTTTSFTIAYIASTDMIVDGSDYLIDYKVYGSAVANAFATVSFSYAFSPGDLPTGLYNFIVYLDYGNQVAESNENNNIVSFGTFDFEGLSTDLRPSTENQFESITCFQDPASKLTMFTGNTQIKKLTVFSAQGSLIKCVLPESHSGELATDDLSPGIYFLTFEFESGHTVTRKILKTDY